MSTAAVTTLRSRATPYVPAPLSLVAHTPGTSLSLRSPGAEDWSKAQGFIDRLLASTHRGPRPPMILDTLLCTKTELCLRNTWSFFGPNEELRIPAAEIRSLRLRVLSREGASLRLNLSVARRGQEPAVTAQFSMTDLDRDEEALDLGLRLARCLGLGGYRIRHRSPADIELVPRADEALPYRSAPLYLPVPSSAESIDYEERAGDAARRSRAEGVSPRHRGLLYDDWQIEEWHPGQRIALSKGGKTNRQAWLWTCLLGIPLALVLGGLVASICAGGFLLLFGFVLFLPVGLVCAIIGTDPPMWLAYLLAVWAIVSALIALYYGLAAGVSFGRWWHEHDLSRRWLLDWEGDELVESWGGKNTARAPLHHFEGVAARTFEAIATAESYREIPVVLEGIGDDLQLFRWVAPASSEREAMQCMAADLAAALANPEQGK